MFKTEDIRSMSDFIRNTRSLTIWTGSGPHAGLKS